MGTTLSAIVQVFQAEIRGKDGTLWMDDYWREQARWEFEKDYPLMRTIDMVLPEAQRRFPEDYGSHTQYVSDRPHSKKQRLVDSEEFLYKADSRGDRSWADPAQLAEIAARYPLDRAEERSWEGALSEGDEDDAEVAVSYRALSAAVEVLAQSGARVRVLFYKE